MNETHITGCIGSIMQFVVAGYAWRLNRRYGTARVGWSLFGAFSLLALQQLVQSSAWFQASLEAVLKINVTYALISFLLLIGMVHLEAMLKERLRIESMERDMREELEREVKSKTAHLTRAIEELMNEIEANKRMGEMIEAAYAKTDRVLARTTIPVAMEPETSFIPTLAPATPIKNEWLAHF